MKAALVLFVIALGLPSLTAAEVVAPIDSVQQFVNIRAESNADSDVIGRLYQGDSMLLVQSIDGWHEIEIEPDLNGYISSDWTTVFTDADRAAAAIDARKDGDSSEVSEPEVAPTTESVAELLPESSPEEVVEAAPARNSVIEEPAPQPQIEAEEVEASAEVVEPVANAVPDPEAAGSEMLASDDRVDAPETLLTK